ncbi:hypothetical protein [Neptuniibacter halophilus]|uniref:hypothetical protein n=1 Tax=Neptuniibacter halophilus TaxID=651666 RepID=UPI002573885B|nr:hypothetical protein [Neptuniibacter halophilus]
MVVWSNTEIAVFFVVLGMVAFKLWTVWHVSNKARATLEGRLIFIWGIAGMTLFTLAAKTYISYQMGMA